MAKKEHSVRTTSEVNEWRRVKQGDTPLFFIREILTITNKHGTFCTAKGFYAGYKMYDTYLDVSMLIGEPVSLIEAAEEAMNQRLRRFEWYLTHQIKTLENDNKA